MRTDFIKSFFFASQAAQHGSEVGIGAIADRIGGYTMLGYEESHSYLVHPSLKGLLKSRGVSASFGSFIQSGGVDVDVLGRYSVISLKKDIEVELSLEKGSPMQPGPSKPAKLKCVLIEK